VDLALTEDELLRLQRLVIGRDMPSCARAGAPKAVFKIDYLRRYDLMKTRVGNFLEIPDQRFDLMQGFLRQTKGRFSRRPGTKISRL
jgi:hypothetical protein